MRRWPVIAGYGGALLVLAGCALIHPRDEGPLAPSSRSAHYQQLSRVAQAAIDRRDYEAARADLEQLASESPRSAEVHHRLGRVFQLQGRLVEAEAAYRRALEIEPEYVRALIGLGEVEAQLGRPGSALKRFEEAIEIDPHEPDAHLAEGRVLEVLGRPNEALACYFRGLERDPIAAPVILRIATLQLARNEPEQALARLDQVIGLTPDDPEAHHQRGLAHLALKHPAQAVDDLRFAAQRLPQHPEVFYHLALALDADHKAGPAREAAERALRLAPRTTPRPATSRNGSRDELR